MIYSPDPSTDKLCDYIKDNKWWIWGTLMIVKYLEYRCICRYFTAPRLSEVGSISANVFQSNFCYIWSYHSRNNEGWFSKWFSVGESDWESAILDNSWENFNKSSQTYYQAQYRIEGSRVYIRGLVKNSSPISLESTIFQLQEGYRPTLGCICTCWSSFRLRGSSSDIIEPLRVNINPDGTVKLIEQKGREFSVINYLSLENINFRLD